MGGQRQGMALHDALQGSELGNPGDVHWLDGGGIQNNLEGGHGSCVEPHRGQGLIEWQVLHCLPL
jgi:hypothetical protein